MDSEKVEESQRASEMTPKVVDMGRVSEETKGLPPRVQESPGIFPGEEL